MDWFFYYLVLTFYSLTTTKTHDLSLILYSIHMYLTKMIFYPINTYCILYIREILTVYCIYGKLLTFPC